jgi:DNA-binding transcriptional LysR family regulator
MELRHVRYFLAVAEELHFGRAAARLNISQPPLSQQIRRLERELQAPLFHRTKRRVELTNAGRVFLDEARALVTLAEQAAGNAQRASRGEIGQLLVGCAVWADFLSGAAIIRHFARRHPDVDVELRDLPATEQVSALVAGHIHVGILRPPVPSKLLASERLLSESLVVAFPRGHRFRDYERVPWKALVDEPYVLVSRRRAPAYEAVVARACHEADVTLKIRYEVEHPQTVLSIVEAGLGVSLVPASMGTLKRPGVAYRRLSPPGPPLETVIAWRRGSDRPLVQAFVAVAREVAARGARGESETRPARSPRAGDV